MADPMDYEALARASLPDLTGPVSVAGLDARVEIYRDSLGIPHARARTLHDAFFAQGFVHAQDRLWQLESDRRRCAGRLAEVLGEQAVLFDLFARRMELDAAARADYDSLDADARAVLDAYAEGVNAFIETTRALPVEFTLLGIEPSRWEGWHCAGVMKVRHVLMGVMDVKLWRTRLLRSLGPEAAVMLGSGHGRDDTLIVPVGARERWEADPEAVRDAADAIDLLADGSNNWAVHGSRTASGKPLLAGDPHRLLEVPNVYYQNHVACPEFDAIGLSIPGVPGMFHFGHTQHVAWCITHAMADTQDVYLERFDEQGRYLYREEWVQTEYREEVIDVRAGKPVRTSIARTANGPIAFGDPASGIAVSLRWTGTDRPNRSLEVVVPMLRARTVGELEETMRPWVDPCNSFVMADVAGDIAYLHRGRIPLRARANAWSAVPGWTGEHDWRGDVPFEELPRLRNPEPGYIVTANNRVCGSEYPYHLSIDYAAPNRARRIIARLDELTAATAEDMASVHGDRHSIASRAYVRAIADLPLEGRAAQARDLLVAWDGQMDPGRPEPAICVSFKNELGGVLLATEGLTQLARTLYPEEPDPTPARTRLRAFMTRFLPPEGERWLGGARWTDVATEALHRALAALEDLLGPDMSAWRFGDVHMTSIEHPVAELFPDAAGLLNPPRTSIGGDADTVVAASEEIGLGVEHSSVARYVFDVGDWERSAWVVPLGASGHPASPHYADQSQAWGEVRLHPMTYDWPAVEADAETAQTLEPR